MGRGKRAPEVRYTVRCASQIGSLRVEDLDGQCLHRRFGSVVGIPKTDLPRQTLVRRGRDTSTEKVLPTKPMRVDPEPIVKPLC